MMSFCQYNIPSHDPCNTRQSAYFQPLQNTEISACHIALRTENIQIIYNLRHTTKSAKLYRVDEHDIKMR